MSKKPAIVRYPITDCQPWLVAGTSTRHIKHKSADRLGIALEYSSMLTNSVSSVVCSQQIHEDKIAVFRTSYHEHKITMLRNCDGMIAEIPSIMLQVVTADCVPVFFADKVSRIVGIAHCGWKGTYLNLTGKMIKVFEQFGTHTKDLIVWTGPAICGDCYEISEDLAAQFKSRFGNELTEKGIIRGRYLNLPMLNYWQAQQMGVNIHWQDDRKMCTRCNNALFPSYRVEGVSAGRIISAIMNKKNAQHED